MVKKKSVSDEIVQIILNRPDSLNAFNKNLLKETTEAIQEAESNNRQVIIFEGEGRAFTAGADLEEAEEEGEDYQLFQDMTRALRSFSGITIGKLHGYVIGGGFEFTLDFDLRYAEEGTTFQMTESEWGLTISNGSTKLLPLIIGYGRAKELILTSREFDANEAAEMGLVAGVYEESEIDKKVMSVAEDIVSNKSQQAIDLNKEGIHQAFQLNDALEYEVYLNLKGQQMEAEEIDWE